MKRLNLYLTIAALFVNTVTAQQIINNFMEAPFSLYFINELTGFAGGSCNQGRNGLLRKTTDGGMSWFNVLNTDIDFLYSISSVDGIDIYITGGHGTVLISKNRGISWVDISYPTFRSLADISIPDKNHIYTVGGGFFSPIFLRSTNGGIEWINVPLEASLDLTGVDFLDSNYGFAVGNRTIIKTTNGGKTLVQKYFNVNGFSDIEIIDSNLIFVSGGGLIMKSIDGGNNWISYNNYEVELLKLMFINRNTGFAGGNGCILRTTNTGQTWQKHDLNPKANFFDIFFINSADGWAVGYINEKFGGILYKTTNSGETWQQLNSLTELPQVFEFLQNYPNPFNPKTKIKYKVPGTSNITLKIFDCIGREITTIVNEKQETGVYEYEFDGSSYASGVYYCKFDIVTLYEPIISRFSEAKKLILIK